MTREGVFLVYSRRFAVLPGQRLLVLLLLVALTAGLVPGCGGGGGGGGSTAGGGTSGGAGPTASPTVPADPGATPPSPPTLAVPQAATFVEGVVLVKTRAGTEALARSSGLRLRSERRWASLGLQRMRILSGETVPEAVRRLSKTPGVEYAEPDYRVKTDEVVPNDPRFGELWALKNSGASGGVAGADLEATLAWDTTQGSSQVVVAVIDTGIDYNHPDLNANMWRNTAEIAGNSIDDDNNGVVDDVYGVNALAGTGNPMDDNEHGTHVAGTIAAVANNGVGVAGVAPGVRLMACKFLDNEGYGSISDAVTCLDYATRMGARIANASWGGGGESQAFTDALNRARAANLLLVCAAGNDGTDNDATPHFPSNYELDNVLAVGASTRAEAVSSFSNYGVASVDLFAPGSAILSTVPGNAYASFNGTSMAAPHVSGIAALVLSTNVSQPLLAVRSRVLAGVEPIAAYAGRCATGGRANARLALAAPVPNVILAGVSPGALLPGASVTLTGQGFGSTQGAGTVRFGTTPATSVTSWSDTRVVAVVPALPVGASSVQVVNDASEASNALQVLVDSSVQYVKSAATHDFRDVSATGTALTLGDDSFHNASLGFTFTFFGEEQTTVTVSSNGYLTFGGNGSVFQNAPIPNSGQPNRLIAPLWTDLDPSTRGKVYTQTRGSAPNREFVVQWNAVPHFPDLGDSTFQAVLKEGSNEVLFHYRDVTFGAAEHDGGASATIGVESVAGTTGVQHAGTVQANTSLRFAVSTNPSPSPSPSASPSPQPSPTPVETLPLSTGWNCVSFPVMQLTQLQVGSGVGKVFVFDATSQSYVQVTPTAANLNAGTGLRRGFWVYATSATSLGYAGTDNDGSVRTVDLKTGWNLIGVPNRQPIAGGDILATDVGAGTTVPFLQTLSAQIPAPNGFLLFRYVSGWRSGQYAASDATTTALAPKQGHWIYAWRPTQLEFQALSTGGAIDKP